MLYAICNHNHNQLQQYIYKCKYREIQTYANTGGLCWSGLLASDFGSSTRGEIHNSYDTNYSQRAAYLAMFKISVCRDPKNPTTSSTAQIQLSTDSFPKSSNSQDHLFRAWRHPHSSPIFCQGFIMAMVIALSFARERKNVPNDYAL